MDGRLGLRVVKHQRQSNLNRHQLETNGGFRKCSIIKILKLFNERFIIKLFAMLFGAVKQNIKKLKQKIRFQHYL